MFGGFFEMAAPGSETEITVAVISQNDAVRRLTQHMDTLCKASNERLAFIRKQYDDAVKAHENELVPHMRELFEWCRGGMPADATFDAYQIGYSTKGNWVRVRRTR